MKRTALLICAVAFIGGCAQQPKTHFNSRGAPAAEGATESGGGASAPGAVIAERAKDSRVWKRERIETLRNGQTVRRTNSYVELGTGMHYRDPADGQLKESREHVEITAEGAKADKLAHKVLFKGNINSASAFTITTPDDKTLRASVRGLAFTDPVGGQVVMFAPVRDSSGVLVPPNTVLYPNAFSGTHADLRATVTKARFESDVILREKLPPPENWNLDPATTLLEVWTEFEAPEPKKTVRTRGGLSDEILDFGAMRMGRGSAFTLDGPDGRRREIPVAKTWMRTAEGKTFLIESVRYSAIARELARLPDRQAAFIPDEPVLRAPSRLAGLAKLVPSTEASPSSVRLAVDKTLLDRSPGLVLDYTLEAGNETNFTFQCDTTYFINGVVNLFGETIFENTVIKYATTNLSIIQTWSNVVFKTDFYRPAIFTSQMDRSVGEDFYAPGAPTNYSHALSMTLPNIDHHHFRISYATTALHTFSVKINHAQFLHCRDALSTEDGVAEVDNALFYNCDTAFSGFFFNNVARHVTVNQCNRLAFDTWEIPDLSSLALTNSLLVNVTNYGNAALTTNATISTTNSPFQTVGAGAHYLAEHSPYRDIGTTNLPATLASDLKRLTTYPPVVFNGEIAQDTTLVPTAPRDLDIPDLGWHATPIDYLVNQLWVTNSTLRIDPGVAIGVAATNGSWFFASLTHGGSLICEGRADNLNHIAAWQLVQEMTPANFTKVPAFFLVPAFDTTALPGLMRVRFTEIIAPPAAVTETLIIQSLGPISGTSPMAILDSQIYGGKIDLWFGSPVAFTNNLLYRGQVEPVLVDSSDFRNNTFYGGSIFSYFNTASGGFYDNIFDSVNVHPDTGDTPNGYNAYTTNFAGWRRLLPNATNDVLVNNIDWQTGPLGAFYLPTNSSFLNAGSRNAGTAGLFHFTSTTNQVKESNSVVNLGFHYVAADGSGVPFDHDGDGVPDYWEDRNGNDVLDSGSGETDWRNYNSPNQLSTSPALQVFTPLK